MCFQQFLLRFGFVIGAVFLFSVGNAQTQVIELKDSAGLKTYVAEKGDTILVGFDSAYILNKKIFKLYQDNYQRVKKGDPATKKLLDEYERLVNFQDSMLWEKEKYYQGLKLNFDSLASTSTRFADRTEVNVTAINQSLANATMQLNNIKALLDKSLEELKAVNKQKFKWALGGFAVGIGVGTLIFLIAN